MKNKLKFQEICWLVVKVLTVFTIIINSQWYKDDLICCCFCCKGAIHKNDCPAERMIPIYLIVGGSFGIIKNLSSLGQRAKNKDEEDADEKNAKTNPFDGILNCFLFAWFIAGALLKHFTPFSIYLALH